MNVHASQAVNFREPEMKKIKMRYLTVLLFTITFFVSCTQQEVNEEIIYEGPEANIATAVLYPTEGSDVTGTVTFTQTDEGVRVTAAVVNLEPETLHGFHIHQFGDCRAPDATSAGGHYNPENVEHGAPTDDIRHMGDLGNIPVDEEGVAEVDFLDTHLEMSGENSIIGRGVIVHANEDDFITQPTGAAGPRLACGVIGVANPDILVNGERLSGENE